jgi:predicted HTH transcriptional regulator
MNNLQEKRHEDKSDYAELLKLLMSNESPILEYKASLWTNYIGTTDELVKGQLKKNWELQDAVVKTVAAFINTDGGTLLIGVLDKPRSAGDEIAQVVGISPDFQWLNKKRADEEGFTHSMIQLLNDAFGSTSLVKLHVDISTPSYDGNILCRVEVKPRQRERNNDVWVKTKTMGDEEFFFRSSDTTTHASAKSAHNYIRHHFEGFSGENNNTGT